MISQLAETHPHAHNLDEADIADGPRRHRPLVVQTQAKTRARWLTVGRVAAWMCFVVLVSVAVARALQVAADDMLTKRVERSEQTRLTEIESAPGVCPGLNQHATRMMTIDELHDLKDMLCPATSTEY